MLAPLRGRRRSRDRRSRPTPAGRSSSRPVATRPAIAKVIASRWSSRLSVAAPRQAGAARRSAGRRRRRRCRAPSARRPAAIPAIRSDSLWRSSPAPRIVVVPLARVAAEAQDRDLVDRRGHVRRTEVDRPCSSDDRTTRSASGSPTSSAGRGAPSTATGRSSMSAPMRAQEVDDGAPRRVDADARAGSARRPDGSRRRPARRRPRTRRPGRARRSPAPPRLLASSRPPGRRRRRRARPARRAPAASVPCGRVWRSAPGPSSDPRPGGPPAGSPT